MKNHFSISLLELSILLSETMDLLNHRIMDHHKQVAYLAFRLGEALSLPPEAKKNLLLAGLLHDTGAFSLRERLSALHFEFENPHYHAQVAYRLFKDFPPLSPIAKIICFHHLAWEEGAGREFQGEEVPIESHIIHLADRVSIFASPQKEILGQIRRITETLERYTPRLFAPFILSTFKELASREYIWFDFASPHLERILRSFFPPEKENWNLENLLALSQLISHIVDFRSSFTATHSAGVAALAHAFSLFLGFSPEKAQIMKVAGYFHDLGKLAVPLEILEKPGPLTPEEFNLMKIHPYYTFRLLYQIKDLRSISRWAAEHHERLDGSGYPFHYRGEELSLESRIMALVDVFVAITEDRPYRRGMEKEAAKKTLQSLTKSGSLDREITEIVISHWEELYPLRDEVQKHESQRYQEFRHQIALSNKEKIPNL